MPGNVPMFDEWRELEQAFPALGRLRCYIAEHVVESNSKLLCMEGIQQWAWYVIRVRSAQRERSEAFENLELDFRYVLFEARCFRRLGVPVNLVRLTNTFWPEQYPEAEEPAFVEEIRQLVRSLAMSDNATCMRLFEEAVDEFQGISRRISNSEVLYRHSAEALEKARALVQSLACEHGLVVPTLRRTA